MSLLLVRPRSDGEARGQAAREEAVDPMRYLHTMIRVRDLDAMLAQLRSQGADVAAGVRQQLLADAARIGGLRLLPGRFLVIEQA